MGLYSRFIDAHPDVQHFAAHSHHPWPDVTRDAVLEAWELSNRYADDKWNAVLGPITQELQSLIGPWLGLGTGEHLVFGSSTFELVSRILSCHLGKRPFSILTTDGEFHSARRLFLRFQEMGLATLKQVPVFPIATLSERLLAEADRSPPDMVFASHVFFETGVIFKDVTVCFKTLAERMSATTALVIDGYHAFGALPVDHRPLADSVFYIAGGYKYAQGGEGVCFAHIPPRFSLLPALTGWFAEFAPFSRSANRFAGATYDFTAQFRLRASLRAFHDAGIDPQGVRDHVTALKRRLYENLENLDRTPATAFLKALPPGPRCFESVAARIEGTGNFAVFEGRTAELWVAHLKKAGILCDSRGERLRLGFGLYHDTQAIDRLCHTLAAIAV